MRPPWADRADELEPTEDIYCDFVAWREWFVAQDETDLLAVLDGIGNEILLYGIFFKVFDDLQELTTDAPSIVNLADSRPTL